MPPRKKLNKSSVIITTKEAAEKQAEDVSTDAVKDNADFVPGTRRSGRRCIANSRFKDMEVQITPKRHQSKVRESGDAAPYDRRPRTQSKKSQGTTSESSESEGISKIQQKISRKRKCKSELNVKSKCGKQDEANIVKIDNEDSPVKIRCHKNQSGVNHVSQIDAGDLSSPVTGSTNNLTQSASASPTLVELSKLDQSKPCTKLAQKENLNPATTRMDVGESAVQESKKQLIIQHQVDVSDGVSNSEVLNLKPINTEMSECLSANGQSVEDRSAKCLMMPEMQVTENLPTSPSNALSKDVIKCDANEDSIRTLKDGRVICSKSKISISLELDGKCVDAGADVGKAVGPEMGNGVNGDRAANGSVSSEKAKDAGSSDKVKVMEEEMMSLLNLFFTDSDQKKNGKSEQTVDEAGKSNLAPDPVSDVCQVMVVTSDGDAVAAAVTNPSDYGKVQLVTSVDDNSKTIEDTQIQNASHAEAQVHILPVGSTVFLLDNDSSIITDADTGTEVKDPEVTLPPVSTECANSMTTTEEKSSTSPKQIHFLVKTSKNKVEINNDGVLSCTGCGNKVDSGVKRAEHVCRPRVDNLLRISDDGTFCCTKCDYKTEKKVNWYKHKLKHQERRYQCPKCEYKASTSSNLKRHMLSHDDVRVFGCKLCWATFPQKVHLLRHIKSKHQPHSVQCSYCDYVCAEVQPDLIAHVKAKHSELCNVNSDGTKIGDNNVMLEAFLRYKCDKCNVYTFNRKDLLQHMKVHKKGPELKFFCEMCSFVTECESRLKRHMLTHTKEKPFGCSMCSYRGSLREHIKRHLKTKHKVDVSLSQQKKIRRYATNKSKPKQDGGTLLEGSFHNKKPYPWSDTRHSEKHFACNFCSMMFTKLISLFKHVHVQHSQLMPPDSAYSCVVCDYTTNQYKRLLLHMRKVHSTTNCMNTPQKQVYVCMSCSYSTPYRLFLHAHLKKEHNMQIVTDKYMMDASKHSSAMIQTSDDTEKKPGSIIKNTVIGKMGAPANPSPSKDSKMVLLQLTPDGPMTPVVINMGDRDVETSNPSSGLLTGTDTEYPIMETGITDTECALDMQCEVIFDDELGQVLQDTNVAQDPVASTSVNTSTETRAEIPVKDSMQVIQEITPDDGSNLQSQLTTAANTASVTTAEDSASSNKDDIQTVESDGTNQVLHLSSGDFLEINGQIYKIEMEDNVS